jgi:hypothetical protein
VSKDKVTVSNERVDAIRKSARPGNISELRGYLGTLNYLRRFIPNLSVLTGVFSNLLKKNVKYGIGQLSTKKHFWIFVSYYNSP